MSRNYDVKATQWFPQYRFGVFGQIQNGLMQGAKKFVMMQVKPDNTTQLATLNEFPALQEECRAAWDQKKDPFFKNGQPRLSFGNMSWASVPLDDLADELDHYASKERVVIVCSCTDDAMDKTEDIIKSFNQQCRDRLPVISAWATARGYYGQPGTAGGGVGARHSGAPGAACAPKAKAAPSPAAKKTVGLTQEQEQCQRNYMRACTKEEANRVLQKYGLCTEDVTLNLDFKKLDDGQAMILAGAIPHCKSCTSVWLSGNRFGSKGVHALAIAIFEATSIQCLKVDNDVFNWFVSMKPKKCQVIGWEFDRPNQSQCTNTHPGSGPWRVWSWREQNVREYRHYWNHKDWSDYCYGLK
jgi:hypothetical protein